MDVFKSNGSPGPEEMENSSKSKRASVVLPDRKDASKLRDVRKLYCIFGKTTMFLVFTVLVRVYQRCNSFGVFV